jgi:hypothetical protein
MVKRQNENITKELLGKGFKYSVSRARKINVSNIFET